jgi:hypothetical protein
LSLLLIFVLVLLIPILLIVLDSDLGRALAGRLERKEIGPSDEVLVDRVAHLEGEVERLASEVERLDDEGQFLNRLLLERGRDQSPPRGERRDCVPPPSGGGIRTPRGLAGRRGYLFEPDRGVSPGDGLLLLLREFLRCGRVGCRPPYAELHPKSSG